MHERWSCTKRNVSCGFRASSARPAPTPILTVTSVNCASAQWDQPSGACRAGAESPHGRGFAAFPSVARHVYLGGDTFWSKWTNLWTAEEDRHGAVLHDYMHDSKILDNPVLRRMQFDYLRAGSSRRGTRVRIASSSTPRSRNVRRR